MIWTGKGRLEDMGYSILAPSDDRELFDDFDDEDYYDEGYYDDSEYEEETVPGFELFTAISVIGLVFILKRRL